MVLDDKYEGGYDEPVIVTASGDHHVDASGEADELPSAGCQLTGDELTHVSSAGDLGELSVLLLSGRPSGPRYVLCSSVSLSVQALK